MLHHPGTLQQLTTFCTTLQNLPEWAEMSKYQAGLFTADGDGDAHAKRLVDVQKIRLQKMDEQGVEFCVLSLTAPGIQVS